MKTKLKLFAIMVFALAAVLRLVAQPTTQFATIYEFGGVNAIPSAEADAGSERAAIWDDLWRRGCRRDWFNL